MFSKYNNMSLSNTDAPSNFEALSTIFDNLQIHLFFSKILQISSLNSCFLNMPKFFGRKTDQTFENEGKSVLRQSGFFPT